MSHSEHYWRDPLISSHPQILLSKIAAHTLNLGTTPTSLLISCSALAHHSHLQFIYPGFLEKVKAAAGKSGTIESQRDARETLKTWFEADEVGVRTIVVHAAMLGSLLSRYTYEYV
jgi:hypothetical protein